MTDTPGNGEREKRRERPTHWSHPVDERRRAGRARRFRRRRVVLAALVLLVAGLVGAYFYLTSDKQVEAFSERYLEDLLGTKVRIGRATFTPSEGLVLENLTVMPPPPFRDALVVAERVELRIDPLSFLRLSPQVTEIVVHRPRFNLVLWDEALWNFQALARARPLAAVEARQRPIVALEDGWVRIERKIAGETVYEHQMQVSGLLLPSETNADSFRFQTDVTSRTVHLSVASGLIDARTGALEFEGQASNVSLVPELYKSLPREAQRIWDRFEPTGSVNIKVLFDAKSGFRLGTDLTGVTFAYQHAGQVYRFENLTGRCAFSATTLALTDVQGLLNGSPIRLSGEVWGLDGDRLGMDLAVSGDHVGFEENRSTLVGLAPHMEGIYTWYSPQGQADVALRVRRSTDPDSQIAVSGTVFCRDDEMTYLNFRYRLDRIRGTIWFWPEGYVTEGLVGRHGQAQIMLMGAAWNPGPCVDAWVYVRGTNVPLDDDLRAALPQAQRDAYDQYSPAGATDLEVIVDRPPIRDIHPTVSVRMDLLGCDMKYAGFPYPVSDTRGQVNILPGRTEIVGVHGRHGQAKIALEGEVVPQEDGGQELHLKVRGEDIALDDDLAAAVPERERKVLQVFHLSGLADVEGTVVQGAETKGRLDYDLGIRLKGARMIYEAFPFLAEQVTGQVHLAGGSCRIESLAGYNSGSRIEARGWIDQREEDFALDLALTGQDVVLSEPLRGALGPEMRAIWSHLQPQGRVDINAHLSKEFGQKEVLKHHVLVTARDAQARFDMFPYPLEHVTGQMEFTGGEVRLHDIRARSGPTEFAIGGRISYDQGGPDLNLAIRTRGLRLEGPLRDALPEPLQRAFAILKPTGRADLNLDRVVYHQKGPNPAEASWTGSAILDEVGMEPGIKVAGMVGTAQLQGRWADGKVAVQGEMRIQQGKVADKEVSDMRLLVEKTEASATVNLKQVEGTFYEGRLEGSATINLAPGGKYAFNLAATEVNFERLLREGFRLEHNISGGRLRGTLGLWATGPDTKTMEASGYAYVDDARLYELPLVVRLLNVFRLNPDDRTAFQKARILYFVRGRQIILGDIRLFGRALDLYGAGTMAPDGKLDMVFLTGKRDDDPLVPALAELMEGVRKELLVVLVSGTLNEPKVETRSLSGLTAPFREMIALVKAQRERDAAARRKGLKGQ